MAENQQKSPAMQSNHIYVVDNQEKAPTMQSNSASTEISSSSRKRKVETLIPEVPPFGEVKESTCQFLFEKKLTHSDVKGQNRIIIPKAYAEQYFGEYAKLESASHIFMDDIGTGKVWKFCFRSWQNGASRMYVLEGTGKFTQEQNIQVGDFIKLYKDNKTDKYRISWRKRTEEAGIYPANGQEPDDLSVVRFQENCADKNKVQATNFAVASNDEYHPQFLPPDGTNQFVRTTDYIDEEYVMRNFNMAWDDFIDYNPFDD